MPPLGLWPLRLVWLALPLVAASSFADALADRSGSFRLVAMALLWAGWVVGLVGTLVPRPETLTLVRCLAPAGLAAVVWATVAGGDATLGDVLALAISALATGLSLAPMVGDAFVDGSSYGAERRMALRVPTAVLLGPLELTWTVLVAGTVAGPLLLGAGQWVIGLIVLVVGWTAGVLAARSLHQLSRRWLVFVPNGLVLHDPIATPEPHLFLRRSVRRIGPALQDEADAALDLSQGATGLLLALELAEPHDVLVATRRGEGTRVETGTILFAPTRPGALLDEARRRRLPVS